MSLLLLEGELLVGLAVGATVTSSWKIVKRPELLLRGACEVVWILPSPGGGKASHKERALIFVRGLGEEGEPSWRSGGLRGNPHLSNGD